MTSDAPSVPLRVLLVNDFGAPYYGAEVQLLHLRDALRRRGHEVMLFSSRAEHKAEVASAADVTCFGTTSRLQALSQMANPSAYLQLRRVLREFLPDLVHVQMFLGQLSPLILPLLRQVPCVYHMVVYNDICPKGSKLLPDRSPCTESYGRACLRHGCVNVPRWAASMAQLALLRRWRPVFDRAFTVSGVMRDTLLAAGLEGIGVLHMGVDPRPMRPALSGPPLVAYAGRLSPEKGVDVLLRAFARARGEVPGALLLIAGDGPQAAALHGLADALGVSDAVEWLGHVPRETLERRFEAAWVQAVPSLWQEPFGNVTAEAMMRGTAVVASRVGGAIDLLADGSTGLLVPAGDVGELADTLSRVLRDRNEADRLGAAARDVALQTLGNDGVADRVLAIYHDVLAAGPKR